MTKALQHVALRLSGAGAMSGLTPARDSSLLFAGFALWSQLLTTLTLTGGL
jgi:hypothetical protein